VTQNYTGIETLKACYRRCSNSYLVWVEPWIITTFPLRPAQKSTWEEKAYHFLGRESSSSSGSFMGPLGFWGQWYQGDSSTTLAPNIL